MVKLDPRENFEGNLEILLQAVADPDLRGILRDHAAVIIGLASGSTEASRSPVTDALVELIALRAAPSDGEQ